MGTPDQSLSDSDAVLRAELDSFDDWSTCDVTVAWLMDIKYLCSFTSKATQIKLCPLFWSRFARCTGQNLPVEQWTNNLFPTESYCWRSLRQSGSFIRDAMRGCDRSKIDEELLILSSRVVRDPAWDRHERRKSIAIIIIAQLHCFGLQCFVLFLKPLVE